MMIEPGVVTQRDGVPYAERYDDIYHSREGGLAQAEAVFLGGVHLRQRWREVFDHQSCFVVLEIGLGLGLNVLATVRAWQQARACQDLPAHARLHVVSIEKHPLELRDLARCHAQHPDLGPEGLLNELACNLRSQWPPLSAGVYSVSFEGLDDVSLDLWLGDVNQLAAKLRLG